ncbi:hypothetical protein V1512DRAFT_245686 [Lipomyces arxii]|uniref:uncharacterized protein n=1 Tax=Lipomyces arxii TaxID=56418 RepID=UPI0034CE2FA3
MYTAVNERSSGTPATEPNRQMNGIKGANKRGRKPKKQEKKDQVSDGEEGEDEQEEDAEDNATATSLPSMNIPFSVERRGSAKAAALKKAKKRKLDDDNFVCTEPEDSTEYVVHPTAEWNKVMRYKNFIVGEEKFAVGDYVFVNHANRLYNNSVTTDPTLFWIGRVLEVRGSDSSHVYVRVFWMYWPNELPGGRQYYHGMKELVASNHMDIIDAMTVSARANVVHWLEGDEEDKMTDLFWRQRYDTYTDELTPIRKHCKCRRYYNPDQTMIWCGKCHQWMHDTCVIEDTIAQYKDDIEFPPEFTKKKRSNSKKTSSKESEYLAPDFPVKIHLSDDSTGATIKYKSKTGEEKTVPTVCLMCHETVEN